MDNNLEITFFNRSAGKITGIHEKNAIGEKCYDVFKTDICSTKCALKRSIETGEDTVTQRVNMKNSKGMLVPISVSTSVLLDYDGDVMGGVQTFRDISTIKIFSEMNIIIIIIIISVTTTTTITLSSCFIIKTTTSSSSS